MKKKDPPKKTIKKTPNPIPDKPVSTVKLRKTFPFFKELKLNTRQIRFVFYYVELNFNSVEAYKRAGYHAKNENSLRATVCEILKNPNMREGIRRYITDSLELCKDTLDKSLIDTFYRRAFYDIAMFYNENGTIKKLKDIPEDWRCVIDGKEDKYYGKEAEIKVETYKLADKEKSLDRLCKYIDLIKADAGITFNLSKETEDKLNNIFNKGKSK